MRRRTLKPQNPHVAGGKKRWAGVSSEERSVLMRKAARARWGPARNRKKNPNAAQLARLRWEKLSPEERREAMQKVRDRRQPK